MESPSPESQPTDLRPTLELKTRVLAWMIFIFVRLILLTYRFKFHHVHHQNQAAALHAKGSYCLAVWHEHLLSSILAHRRFPCAPLASLSKDGDLVAFVMNRLGYRTIRGSSSRRGPEARGELIDAVEEGLIPAITVDGPRGPRHVVKGGVIDIARRTGVAVLPLHAASRSSWVLKKSWDQFQIPRPFSTIHVVYGEPMVFREDIQGLEFGHAKGEVRKSLLALEGQWRVLTHRP